MRQRDVMIHINITREVRDELKEIAKKQGRTVTELVREGIAEVLNRYKYFRGNSYGEKRNDD